MRRRLLKQGRGKALGSKLPWVGKGQQSDRSQVAQRRAVSGLDGRGARCNGRQWVARTRARDARGVSKALRTTGRGESWLGRRSGRGEVKVKQRRRRRRVVCVKADRRRWTVGVGVGVGRGRGRGRRPDRRQPEKDFDGSLLGVGWDLRAPGGWVGQRKEP